jgi:hypothetical protein
VTATGSLQGFAALRVFVMFVPKFIILLADLEGSFLVIVLGIDRN